MLERDRRYKLGAAGPRIEIDDAYIGGERTGEGCGRGRRGHTPFIVAIETSDDGRPLHARLQVVRGFGPVNQAPVLQCRGRNHCRQRRRPMVSLHRRTAGHHPSAPRHRLRSQVSHHPAFRWANTVLANVKNSLLAAHRQVGGKHLPRYLGAFAWRFNRRFVLKTIHERLAIAATTTPPMPYRLLKLAEARW